MLSPPKIGGSPESSFHELSELPMAELEACVEACMAAGPSLFVDHAHQKENDWATFETAVRSAASIAFGRLRAQQLTSCAELLRLCEFEEQTRCQAFQAAMMGEVKPSVYQATVRSILEKLLGKLETYAPDPSSYQAAAQCLSEYMSALNHHCDICAVPRSPAPLPAIAEDFGLDSSDYPSELGSEDAETLSVHSETVSDHGSGIRLSGFGSDGQTTGALGFGRTPPGALGWGRDANAALGGSGVVSAAAAMAIERPPSSCTSASGSATAASDLDELRKERRREANKKASVKYRSKKNNSMQQVLAELGAARQQVGALSSQNAVLAAENQLLKQQVEFLQGVVQGGRAAGCGAGSPQQEALQLSQQPQGAASGAGSPATAAAAATAPPMGAEWLVGDAHLRL